MRVVSFCYALWLVGLMVAFYLGHSQDALTLEIVLIAGAIPAFLQTTFLPSDMRGVVVPAKFYFALVLVILVSYIANAANVPLARNDELPVSTAWTWIVYTLNTTFICAIATIVASSADKSLLRRIAAIYSLLAAAFLAYVDVSGTLVWGRLQANDITPNVWGLMGLNTAVASFAWPWRRSRLLVCVPCIVGLYTITLAQSREHMLAFVIALLVVAMLRLRDSMHIHKAVSLCVGTAILFLAAAILLDPYLIDGVQYVVNNVLLLNSTNRGLDSGVTGRADIWQATFDLWMRHPLFGIGFRQHELFLEGGMPAHNAYLAMLADTGVAGFVVFVWLQLRSFAAAWNVKDTFVIVLLTCYVVIGFFDRRTIDAGNTFSLFFLMGCAVALTNDSLRRKTVLHLRSAPLIEPAAQD